MKKILITGATGNVGQETLRHLQQFSSTLTIRAGVRNVQKSASLVGSFPALELVPFDFERESTFAPALSGITTLFLLRPPHISAIEEYFRPLINTARQQGVQQVLFISVQGAEQSSLIPHHKIEKLLLTSGMEYLFLRPSYFMQNLSTTLLPEIQQAGRLYVPAGDALFNWLDVANLGEAAALLLHQFEAHKNRAYDITGYENLSFREVARQMSYVVGKHFGYTSPNLLRFYLHQRKKGTPAGMVLVMLLLHYLPRFQASPAISTLYEELTGKKPTTLAEFLERERSLFK